MPKYKKKPVIVDAIIWDGSAKSFHQIVMMNNSDFTPVIKHPKNSDCLLVVTLNGKSRVDLNDYVIRTINGELYPCKPNLFKQLYDKV